MDGPSAGQQQQQELPSISNNFSGPCTIFYGRAPHILNLGVGDASIGLPLEQCPQSAPEGVVLIGNDIIAGPPVPGQMIRKVTVDKMPPKYFVCDRGLRELIQNSRPGAEGGCLLSRGWALNKVAMMLQNIHIQRPARGYDEMVSRKLTKAIKEIKSHLREMINSFTGKEYELGCDWTQDGPGELAREYFTNTLAFLQEESVDVIINDTGAVSCYGQSAVSCFHTIDIKEDGINFDFTESLGYASVVYIPWSQLHHLPRHGISFRMRNPSQIPMAGWFSNLRRGGLEDGAQISEILGSKEAKNGDRVAGHPSPVTHSEDGDHHHTVDERCDLDDLVILTKSADLP